MIGLKIRLLQGNEVLDEIELRDTRPGTEVRQKIEWGGTVHTTTSFKNSTFLETYTRILSGYTPKLMSNEQLSLSINSFLYDPDKKA